MRDVALRFPSLSRRNRKPPEGFDGVHILRHGRQYDPAWDLWRPTRRWPGVVLSALVTAGLLTALAYQFQHHVAAASKPFVSTAPHLGLSPAYFPPIAKDKKTVEHFSGKKGAFNVPFNSPGGLTSWTFTCSCTNNFDVTIRDATGTIVAIPVNLIGVSRVAAVANYPAGNYTLDVGADGPWTLNFIDESGLPVVKTPFTYLSSGTSVLGPFAGSNRTVEAGYQAALGQLFTVQVVDSSDNVIDNAVITLRSSYKVVTLPKMVNPYYLIVNGAGLWLIKVT